MYDKLVTTVRQCYWYEVVTAMRLVSKIQYYSIKQILEKEIEAVNKKIPNTNI